PRRACRRSGPCRRRYLTQPFQGESGIVRRGAIGAQLQRPVQIVDGAQRPDMQFQSLPTELLHDPFGEPVETEADPGGPRVLDQRLPAALELLCSREIVTDDPSRDPRHQLRRLVERVLLEARQARAGGVLGVCVEEAREMRHSLRRLDLQLDDAVSVLIHLLEGHHAAPRVQHHRAELREREVSGRPETTGGVVTGGAVEGRIVQEEQLPVGAEPHVQLDLVDPDLLRQGVRLQAVLRGMSHRAAMTHDQDPALRAVAFGHGHSPTLCSYFSRTRSTAGSSSFCILASASEALSPAEYTDWMAFMASTIVSGT